MGWPHRSRIVRTFRRLILSLSWVERLYVRRNALWVASCEGDAELVRHLLDIGADAYKRGPNGTSPLEVASRVGHTHIVSLLLNNGDEIQTNGKRALRAALRNGHAEAAQHLLSRGARIDAIDMSSATLLIEATQKGYAEIVSLLLENGVNVNEKTANGMSALWKASYYGHSKIVHILLEHGACVDVSVPSWSEKRKGWHFDGFEDYFGEIDVWFNNTTALWQASLRGHAEVVKLLVNKGAQVDVINTDDGESALWAALRRGHRDVSRILLESDIKGNAGAAAILKASEEGWVEIVKFLLEHGVQVDSRHSNFDATALIVASENGHASVVHLLLEKGAHTETKRTSDGATALWIASRNGHAHIVTALLVARAKLNVLVRVMRQEHTPFSVARLNGHDEVAELLMRHV